MNPIEKSIQIAGSASALSRLIGVSPQAVCFWRDGKRGIPAERCSAIERVTHGRVTRQELRPNDWHLIWPELKEPSHA